MKVGVGVVGAAACAPTPSSCRSSETTVGRAWALAATMESDVETAVAALLDDGVAPDADRVRALVKPAEVDVPGLVAPVVDLRSYDALLASGGIS